MERKRLADKLDEVGEICLQLNISRFSLVTKGYRIQIKKLGKSSFGD